MSEPIHHFFQDGPVAVAPYSHAVEVDGWLFVTGQMPILPDGTVPEGIEAQTRTVFDNLRSVMARCGFEDGHIVQARVFLTRFEAHYERMNAVYATLFPPQSLPARTCVGVTGLARGCDIEIDLIVRKS
ncbi:RidA family protein [Roseixanthobacter liquoris]|uniref:RidA family protein n=1 Tax=Roseixanthobacter liquoris TaxID=3119921 RepID=UPI0037282EA7